MFLVRSRGAPAAGRDNCAAEGCRSLLLNWAGAISTRSSESSESSIASRHPSILLGVVLGSGLIVGLEDWDEGGGRPARRSKALYPLAVWDDEAAGRWECFSASLRANSLSSASRMNLSSSCF